MDKPPLRNMRQAAAWLGISWETLRKKATAREVPFTMIGGSIRFAQHHLDAIVAAGEREVAKAPSVAKVRAIRAAQDKSRRNDPPRDSPRTDPPRTSPPPTGPRTPPPPTGPKKTDGTALNAA